MIYYRNDVRKSGVNARKMKATLQRLLAAVGETGTSISLSLVDDRSMKELNRGYRDKDKATDVLSFQQREGRRSRSNRAYVPPLGDIVISVDTAKRQAAEYDAPLERELERLMIHGLLHLLGHDHVRAAERRRMELEERRLAACIGMPWPYER